MGNRGKIGQILRHEEMANKQNEGRALSFHLQMLNQRAAPVGPDQSFGHGTEKTRNPRPLQKKREGSATCHIESVSAVRRGYGRKVRVVSLVTEILRNRLHIRGFSESDALRTSSNKSNTLAAPSVLKVTNG